MSFNETAIKVITSEKSQANQLYEATTNSDEQQVRDLIAAGYDVNAATDGSRTSLEAAIKQEDDTIAMLLIEAGARLNDDMFDAPELLRLALRSTVLTGTAVTLLKVASEELKKPVPKYRYDISPRALYWAVEGNNTEAIQPLLDMDVPIDQVNERDATALFTAVELGHYAVTKTLLKCGAKWDITKRDGRNVLDVALAKNDIHMVELLLAHLYSVYETMGAADPDLDRIFRNMDTKEALRLLNAGRSLVQREIKRLQLEGEGGLEPVVGLGNDYLKTLSSLVSDLEDSVNDESAEKNLDYVVQFVPHCLILESVISRIDEKLLFPLRVSLEGHRICIKPESRHWRLRWAMNGIELPNIFLRSYGKVWNDRHTGSDVAFLHALSWLLTCLTQHPNCINAEGALPLLPSRVIDVGPPDGSQDPFLMSGQGRRGRYIALSHRWGSSDITKTTTANLHARMECIKFSSFTQTMQDAITIVRELSIRYLWIDSLCIIQDSHSDWSVEACNMANIYRNALVTIAAAAAFDHSERCFMSRSVVSRELHLPQSLENLNGAAEPLCIIAEYDGSGAKRLECPLDSRGWILQEQILSPRILKYSWNQLHWECISSNESEHLSSATAASSDALRFKRALGGFRSTSMALNEQTHASWRQIVHSYTRRTLTKDTDKLMAVMGIAKLTGEKTADHFLAGLWEGELWRDLLWRSDMDTVSKHPPVARLETIQLSSWSWASVNCPVSYTWPAGSNPALLKRLLEVVAVDVDSEIYIGDVRGSLLPKGQMRKFFVRKNDSTSLFYEENCRSSPQINHKRLKVEEFSQNWYPDVFPEGLTEAWLLAVASEYYWIHCLALVQTQKESEYKRVGICHVDAQRIPGVYQQSLGINIPVLSYVIIVGTKLLDGL